MSKFITYFIYYFITIFSAIVVVETLHLSVLQSALVGILAAIFSNVYIRPIIDLYIKE